MVILQEKIKESVIVIMKHRYAAILMGTILSFTALTGCEASQADVASSDSGETIYGEVSKIDGDTITIEVGTRKEADQGGKPKDGEADVDSEKESEDSEGDADSEEKSEVGEKDADSDEKSEDFGERPEGMEEGEAPSMLELTGEEKEITVTDDTVFTREAGGGFGGGQPEGDMPEKPEDGGGADGGNSDEVPEKPEDAADEEKSDDSSGSEDTEDSPDKGNSEAPSGEGKPEAAEEEISIDDISEGDTIAVTFDEDGKVASITVIFGGMGDMDEQEQSAV